MKRKSLVTGAVVVALAMCWVGFVSAITISPSDQVFARRYGTNQSKTFSTLTNALTLLGSNVARTLVIDGGAWTCTNSLDWPSNITMEIRPDSSINISTDMVMNLDGVNILDPGNRLIFPGLGIATGPIGNAFADAKWQGDRSFYLAPIWTSVVQNVVYSNDLAGLSNGIIGFTTNLGVGISNGVTLYTREQVAASNALAYSALTSHVAEIYLKTNNPVQVEQISYTGMPYLGSALALASADGWNTDPTFANGWEHLSNFTIIDDTIGAWSTTEHQFTPSTPGRYQITVNVAFNNWASSNFFPLAELALLQNAGSNKFPAGDPIMASNTIFIGQASGAGKFVNRVSPSGVTTFKKDIGSTAHTWKVFYRIQEDTCSVNFGSASIQYLGSTNLAK